MPSFQGSQRRDVRRRLAAAGHAAHVAIATEATATPRGGSRPTSVYSQKALPEQHAPLATRIPVQTLPFVAAVLGLLTFPAALAAITAADAELTALRTQVGARWQNTAAMVHQLADARSAEGLTATWGLSCFLLAAVFAAVTRTIRRHRLDDHRGRYRSWGWMSVLFAIAAASFVLPLDQLAKVVMRDGTGRSLGGTGQGWWMLVVAAAWLPVGLWAVLPLTQRVGAGLWLTAALGAWLTAGGIEEGLQAGWQPHTAQLGSHEFWGVVAASLRAFAPSLAAVGGLMAARGVIREARGLVAPRPVREPRRRRKQAETAGSPEASVAAKAAAVENTDDVAELTVEEPATENTAEVWNTAEVAAEATADASPHLLENGDEVLAATSADNRPQESDADERRLSKAERRRLRRQARKNRAA